MTMLSPPLRELFVQFRDECEWIRSCYNTYAFLWEEGGRPLVLMNAAAPAFFNDLNRILIEYLYLRICLVTDPATSPARGGPRNNLTCHFLNEELQKANAGKLPDEIKTLAGEFVRLRDFLLPARNKLLAHLDVEHVFAGHDLGARPEKESALFFEAMQNYCDAVGREVGEGPCDFTGSGRGPGDAMDLLRIIELGLVAKEQRNP